MKRLLVFLLVAALIFVGVGVYQNWFDFSTTNASGKRSFSVAWNADKFKGDMGKLSAKAKSAGKKLVDKVRGVGKDVGENQREVTGTVASIDTADKLVTLEVDGEAMAVPFTDSVDVSGLEGKEVVAALDVTDDGVILRAIKPVDPK